MIRRKRREMLQSRGVRTKVTRVVLAGFLMIAALLWGAPASQAYLPAEACGKVKTKDYAASFGKFPPVRQIPKSGKLPFGPKQLSVGLLAQRGILAGGGKVGFSLSSPLTRGSYRIGWDMTVSAKKLGGGDVARSRHIRLGASKSVNKADLGVPVSARPGFYRVEMTIRDSETREVLGRFGQYFRVVPRLVKARLAVGVSAVNPGEVVPLRVENLGTLLLLSYVSREPIVERHEDGQWTPIPLGPVHPPGTGFDEFDAPTVEIAISAGGVGPCEGLRLPQDLTPGHYRATKYVNSGRRRFAISAAFQVYSPQGRLERPFKGSLGPANSAR
jgi:hypothetical protein